MRKPAFSLIELVVVIAIIALLATISLPTLKSFFPKDERKVFLENLNSLTFSALSNAILSHKLTRVTFDFNENKIYLEEETGKKSLSGKENIFERITSKFGNFEIDFPASKFKIQNFFIDTRDEMKLFLEQVKKEKVWFFITSDGIAQNVTLNLIDLINTDGDQFSFVLNPFTTQFAYYEKFMSPS